VTPGMRVHRLAVGCVGILLSSGFALGANPALAAGGPFRVPSSSVREAAGAPMAGRAWNGPTQAAGSTATGAYTALSPTRLLDTRKTGQTLGAAGSLNLTVTAGSVPSAATAVALNVTVTDTTASSYLSVYPAGETQPLLSNLNWVAGETVPNMVMVPIGSGGQVTFYNNTGSTDVVVDLEGYFAAEATGSTSGSYVPLAPARITDTRPDSQEPNSGDTLGPGSTLDVQVAGAGDVPSAGVTAALLNVTVTDTTSSSFLAVYPQGTAYPGSSNLNWLGGETVANRVVVPVGTSGEVELFNNAGSTDVVVDVDGYFTNGSSTPTTASLFSPITPVRVLDTRNTTGQTLGPGATLTQAMAGVDGIASNASAVVTNVTATDTTAASFFTVYPGGTMPLASDVNWGPGQTVPNLTVATLGGTGALSVYNHSGSADLVIDAFGYFAPETSGGTVPISVEYPLNWSGYAVESGPYTSVTGTFTVPSLVDPPTDAIVSEWVGIDGATNPDLIQAGVEEDYEVPGCPGLCIQPWWEILPQASTNITDVTVSAGDQVTVTITQVSGTSWDITLTDDTNGETTGPMPNSYTGLATSAEWIVEDPYGYGPQGNEFFPFSDYTTTTFNALGFTRAETGLTEFIMEQSGDYLSTPSAWTGLATGFAVAYGDVAPPAP
jgi:hypothetical protein